MSSTNDDAKKTESDPNTNNTEQNLGYFGSLKESLDKYALRLEKSHEQLENNTALEWRKIDVPLFSKISKFFVGDLQNKKLIPDELLKKENPEENESLQTNSTIKWFVKIVGAVQPTESSYDDSLGNSFAIGSFSAMLLHITLPDFQWIKKKIPNPVLRSKISFISSFWLGIVFGTLNYQVCEELNKRIYEKFVSQELEN